MENLANVGTTLKMEVYDWGNWKEIYSRCRDCSRGNQTPYRMRYKGKDYCTMPEIEKTMFDESLRRVQFCHYQGRNWYGVKRKKWWKTLMALPPEQHFFPRCHKQRYKTLQERLKV